MLRKGLNFIAAAFFVSCIFVQGFELYSGPCFGFVMFLPKMGDAGVKTQQTHAKECTIQKKVLKEHVPMIPYHYHTRYHASIFSNTCICIYVYMYMFM